MKEIEKSMRGKYGEYMRQYWYISIVGVLLFAMGIGGIIYSFLDLETSVEFIAGILFSVGLSFTVIGISGYLYEKKNYGIKKIKTERGFASLILGFIAFFTFPFFFLSLTLGAVAIYLGRIAMRHGDNTYGRDGFYIGIIAVALELIIFSLILISGVISISLFPLLFLLQI